MLRAMIYKTNGKDLTMHCKMSKAIEASNDLRAMIYKITFPPDARRSTTASIKDLCSILHLCSGLLKSGFGHCKIIYAK
jgi:hypothetical protein